MLEEQDYPVGYKKPPRHMRFKPGQSGNPHGRPKKPRTTMAESFERELNAHILLKEGGKQRKITKREAIAKQQINKAVQGDARAAEMVMRAIQTREADRTDSLSPVLQAMRAIHDRHEMEEQVGSRPTDASSSTANDPDELHDGHA